MNFGVTIPNFGKYANNDEILKLSLHAEDLGFDSLWVSDHVIIPSSHKGFGDVFFDPLLTLSYIASKTSRIKLGISVIILPYRNPVVLAKMISTLDQLSNGRVILGVGAGWMEEEFNALGVPYSSRGEITNEYIQVLKTLWSEDKPAFKGKHAEFSDIEFLPKPYQRPGPPIWVGGGSNKAMERAVRYADGWHPVGLTPEELKQKLEHLAILQENQQKESFTISLRRNLEINDDKDISDEDTLRGSSLKIINGIREYQDLCVTDLILHFLSGTSDGVMSSMKTFSSEIRPNI